MKPIYVLRNWAVVTPDGKAQQMSGNVYGHLNYNAGEKITTSKIVRFHALGDTDISDVLIETENSYYRLMGEPNKEYDAMMKNDAINRTMLAALANTEAFIESCDSSKFLNIGK